MAHKRDTFAVRVCLWLVRLCSALVPSPGESLITDH